MRNKVFPIEYVEYMQSDFWRAKRHAFLSSKKWRCERCGARKRLQAHHKTYANLGNEKFEDLEALCYSCHAKVHDHMYAEAKKKRKRHPTRRERAQRRFDKIEASGMAPSPGQIMRYWEFKREYGLRASDYWHNAMYPSSPRRACSV